MYYDLYVIILLAIANFVVVSVASPMTRQHLRHRDSSRHAGAHDVVDDNRDDKTLQWEEIIHRRRRTNLGDECSVPRALAPFDLDLHCGVHIALPINADSRHCRIYEHLPSVIQVYINRVDDAVNIIMEKVSRWVDPEEFGKQAVSLQLSPCQSQIENLRNFNERHGGALHSVLASAAGYQNLMSLWSDVIECHHGYLENALLNARCSWDEDDIRQVRYHLVPSTSDLMCRLYERTSTSSRSRDPITTYLAPKGDLGRYLHNSIIYRTYKDTLYRLQAFARSALDTDLCS